MTTDDQGKNVRRYIIRRYIDATIEGVENPPFRGDLIPQFALMGLARRAVNCHLAIEVGLKALIEDAGGEFKCEHGLLSQLHGLENISAAEDGGLPPVDFLRNSFEEAVKFYRLNANVDTQFRSLDDYLGATGGAHAYQQYRYWILSQSSYPLEMQKFNLGIHIEIMYAIRGLLSARLQTVHDRVESTIARAVQEGLSHAAAQRQNSDEYAFVMRFINERRSRSQAYTDMARNKFQSGDEFANLVFMRVHRVLSGSTDTAVQYFITTQFVQEPMSQEIPVPRFVEYHEGTAAEALSPGGTSLGWLQKRQDGLWSVELWFGDHLPNGLQLVNRRIDGLRWLAQQSTVEVTCIVRGEQPHLRRALGSSGRPFSGFSSDSNVHELELWDDDHPWQVGQEITIRVPFGDAIEQVLEGTVVEANGRKVLIQGEVVISPRRN